MSEPSETSGRPLASNLNQPTPSSQQQPSYRRNRTTSQSSDERVGGTKSTSSRHRPGTRKEASSLGPHLGSSRGHSSTMQRSASPTQLSPDMSTVKLTRSGRISKAKKGLKVHNCDECGRSYTRAEHLRRHQKNHARNAVLVCDFPDCRKKFYRPDLLQRHQERHNEESRRPSFISQGSAPDADPQVSASIPLPTPIVTTLPQQHSPYYQQTVSPMPETTTPPSQLKQQRPYGARQASVTIPVAVDSLQGGISWNDPFSHSPNYSSSSGYASPIASAGDYANMFAHPPYGSASNRTRTSSNASFIEPWVYPSHSPASATSTMAYTWTSNDKAASISLPYLNATSYPSLAGMPTSAGADPMPGYGNFGPKTMAQRDEEEQPYLFPEQSFGMGQIDETFPFEQYLDNYWRLFHPSFPVVHRTTFGGVNESPMLRAAMIAVGAQYSNDPLAKRRSRILHDRCMKLFDQRDRDMMVEPERLCDHQSLFLVEVLSQYRARRAANSLSSRFGSVYEKLAQNLRAVGPRISEILSSLAQPENATYERWREYIDLAGQQRLALGCFILEYQQAVLLAREPRPSMIQPFVYDLPFPSHITLWEADNHMAWALASQQYTHLPTYIYEIMPDVAVGPFDQFQSLLLIASQYNHFSNAAIYLSPPPSPAIEHLLDDSPVTKHALLTAKLLQVTPIRALLAVSGESWILSEKVPSPPAFQKYKSTLRVWASGLWATTTEPQAQAVKDALRISLELLQHAVAVSPDNVHLELGADMGLYFAALVIWAVTVASHTRLNTSQAAPQPVRYQSHSPLPTNHANGHFSAPSHISSNSARSSNSPNPAHPSTMGLMPHPQASPAPAPTSNCMLYSELATTSINFLQNAPLELDFLGIAPQWPSDLSRWHRGCAALMRWVKMRLRNGAPECRDSVIGSAPLPTGDGTGRGGDGLGEVLDGVVAVLEKIMTRGWIGWCI